ncbi:MAG: hypothetical protein LUB61_01975 [Eggerthellaceae bacterium]|nr:hypothetical protein [Eggerthellaceae bacterium]
MASPQKKPPIDREAFMAARKQKKLEEQKAKQQIDPNNIPTKCSKCIKNCPLSNPSCKVGRDLAQRVKEFEESKK